MTIPDMPALPIADVDPGPMDAADLDAALTRFHLLTSGISAAPWGTSGARSMAEGDLQKLWGYTHGSAGTWTVPAGINSDTDVAKVLLIEQLGDGVVTLVIDPSYTLVTPLGSLATTGPGTGLWALFFPDGVAGDYCVVKAT